MVLSELCSKCTSLFESLWEYPSIDGEPAFDQTFEHLHYEELETSSNICKLCKSVLARLQRNTGGFATALLFTAYGSVRDEIEAPLVVSYGDEGLHFERKIGSKGWEDHADFLVMDMSERCPYI